MKRNGYFGISGIYAFILCANEQLLSSKRLSLFGSHLLNER